MPADVADVMELLLNILWAMVACGAFLVLLPRSRGGKVPVLALACVVALLFPIISASDDLNLARDAWEESASIRRGDAAAAAFVTAHVAILPAAVSLAIAVIVFVLHRIQVVLTVVPLRPSQCDPRSPPLS